MPRDWLITGSTDADCRILPRWYMPNVSNPFDGGSAGWTLHQPVERFSHLEGLEVRIKLPRCLDSWWDGCVCVNDPYLEDTSISLLLMVGVLARILLFFLLLLHISCSFRKLCSGVKDHNSHGTCEAAMRGNTWENWNRWWFIAWLVVFLVRSHHSNDGDVLQAHDSWHRLRSAASSNPRFLLLLTILHRFCLGFRARLHRETRMLKPGIGTFSSVARSQILESVSPHGQQAEAWIALKPPGRPCGESPRWIPLTSRCTSQRPCRQERTCTPTQTDRWL